MFELRERDNQCIASIEGEMTIYNVAELQEKLQPVFEDPRAMIFDLSGVNDIDSAGVQLLMSVKKERAQHELRTAIVNHSDCVIDCFATLGMVAYFGDDIVIPKNEGETH